MVIGDSVIITAHMTVLDTRVLCMTTGFLWPGQTPGVLWKPAFTFNVQIEG